ncbi:MAG: restriction endonuclease subunit S [candidate division WOR-3 bacterium]
MKSTWPTKKLGEIAEIYSGGRSGITKKDYVERGFPAFSAAGQDGFTKEAYDSGFAVILSSIGSRCGKCFYAEGEWTALANTQIIKFENPVTAKFMYYYLNDENKWPKTGTGQPFISPSFVKNLIVPLPPLPIQQKIVKILDTVQSAVEIHDKIIEKTKELKKSLMAELFKYGGPSFRKGRKLKETEIGEIPEDWEVVRLGEVCKIYQPKTITLKEISESGPYKVYGANGVIGYFTKYNHEESEVLVTCRGSTCGTINLSEPKSWITGNAMVVHPISKDLFKMFLYYLLLNLDLSEVISGSGQPQITIRSLSPFKIPLPTLPEQQEIAEILQTIDQKIEIEQKKKELYEELFKTLLNKIMNQEIDVDSLDLSELEN